MLAAMAVSISIFLMTIFVYIMYIYYEDRKAILYNSNWIYREDDIDYVDGTYAARIKHCFYIYFNALLIIKCILQL